MPVRKLKFQTGEFYYLLTKQFQTEESVFGNIKDLVENTQNIESKIMKEFVIRKSGSKSLIVLILVKLGSWLLFREMI